MFDIESNLYKQAAKWAEAENRYIKARADADRCKELLRRCNNIMTTCPICKGNLRTWSKIDENQTIIVGHADDCELNKELGDAR